MLLSHGSLNPNFPPSFTLKFEKAATDLAAELIVPGETVQPVQVTLRSEARPTPLRVLGVSNQRIPFPIDARNDSFLYFTSVLLIPGRVLFF